MKYLIPFSFFILFPLTSLLAQESALSPEEKARQAADDMHKRLGLKAQQLPQVYALNLEKIQKVRAVKTEYGTYGRRTERNFQQIKVQYNTRLRSVLTPEQYRHWELLQDEARLRRNQGADQQMALLEDPESIWDGMVVQ